MKPPSNDANRPNPGTPTPDKGAPETGSPGAPSVPSQAAKPAVPSTDASKPEPARAEPGKPSEPVKPAVPPSPSNQSPQNRPAPGQGSSGAGPAGAPASQPRPLASAPEPPRSAVFPAQGAKPASPATDAAKPDLTKPAASGSQPQRPEPGKDVPKSDPLKSDPLKSDPLKSDPLKSESSKSEPPKADAPKPGAGGPVPGGAPKPAGAITDGPIIDLTAKRVADPAGAAKASPPGAAKTDPAKPDAARASAPSPAPRAAPPAEAAGGSGFGRIAAAGLLGGVIGAGLLLAVEKAGVLGQRGDDARLTALDQRVSGQFSTLDQRIAALAPRDAVSALDKRVASNEAALKPLPDAVRSAETAARQALERAGAAGAPAATGTPGDAQAPVVSAPSVPADLIARLDSLDQRVSALQEEPGRDQSGDAKLSATQAGTGQFAALDERLKALEGRGEGPAKAPNQADLGPKLAALQGEVESRTRANAEADTALGQRLDALQQALDTRVKAATEAVQSATQASQQAVDAGKAQASETAKAVDRRLQEQGEKIAALDKSLAQRAEASTVQAALRVVTADRIAAALSSGAPYAEPLASLRKLETGDSSRVDALAPFADQGAPTSAQLAAEFRAIADRVAASRKAAQAREVAATGDIKSRLLSMADSIVQVRKVDSPATPEAGTEADPVAKVQAALDRGALQEAAQAFETLPPEAKAEGKDFGARLKARAAAALASQALLSDAFKGLPAGPSAPAPGR